MMARYDTGELRAKAVGRWREILVSRGVPEEMLASRREEGPCPACGGTTRFRFDDKEGRGTHFCSHCGAGDGFVLYAKCFGLDLQRDFLKIKAEIAEILGMASSTGRFKPYVPPVAAAAPQAEVSMDEIKARLVKLWGKSKPVADGDHVMCYLHSRGLELTTAQVPKVLRSIASLMWRDRDGTKAYFQGMLALVQAADGRAVSIHRTYLKDGRKAPVAKAKKLMTGTAKLTDVAAAIRLYPVTGDAIGFAEGIETAIAAHLMYGVPVWACHSNLVMEKVKVPEGVKEVYIFGDNDPPDPKSGERPGEKSARILAQRLRHEGYLVHLRLPVKEGTDFLDLYNERKAAGTLKQAA